MIETEVRSRCLKRQTSAVGASLVSNAVELKA